MTTFTQGLPNHYILFSQTPKAQEQARRLFTRCTMFLAAPLLGLGLFGPTFLGGLLLCLFLGLLALCWNTWNNWQKIPFAVNPSHPLMELDSTKKAEVMIRLNDGSWVEAGTERYRLIADDLLSGFNLVALDDNYTILGYFTNKKTIGSNLRRTMALLNQALALRDAHNGVEDTIESARERETMDYGLLSRDWPEEVELEDAAGPIAKRLRGQEQQNH